MTVLRSALVVLLLGAAWGVLACGSKAGDACTAAAGTCVLGGATCAKQAAESAQDCNPDDNPGGAFCCLQLGDGGP